MERTAPDPAKLLEAWMEWERGETAPGRVMSNLKTAGIRDLLEDLAEGSAGVKVAVADSERDRGLDTIGLGQGGPGPSVTDLDQEGADAAAATSGAGARPPVRRGGDQIIPRPLHVEPGAPAAWAGLAAEQRQGLTVAAVATAFRHWNGRRPPSAAFAADAAFDIELPRPGPRPAAVLCALFDEDGEAHVVLTRRSSLMRSHTGEVAFPGGRLDAGEAPLDAALREAREEVGILAADVTIIGQLSSLHTVGRPSLVTPFVGTLAGRPLLRVNPAEVARAFTVPFSELLAPDVFHEERWVGADGIVRLINFFDLAGETLWGATARMVRELLEIVVGVESPDIG